LYSGIGQNQEKCALLKSRELRAARFVRKFLYKNSYAPKAACICELLLGFFEKCAKRSTHYQKLYFDCDSGLYMKAGNGSFGAQAACLGARLGFNNRRCGVRQCDEEKREMMTYWGRIFAAAAAAIALTIVSYITFPLGVLFPITILVMIYVEWRSRTPKL
jgi:hypothetical protein